MYDMGLFHLAVEVIQHIGDNVCPILLFLIFNLVGTAAPSRREVVKTCLFMAQPMHRTYSPLLRDIGYLLSYSDDDDTPTRDTGKAKKSRFTMHMHPQNCKSCSPTWFNSFSGFRTLSQVGTKCKFG